MKRNYLIYSILNLAIIFFTGCKEDKLPEPTILQDNITTGNLLDLQASKSTVVLSQDLFNEEAVRFTWKEGRGRGKDRTLSYLFKIDIAGRDFSTAIPTEEIGDESKVDGRYTKIYTHKQLNDIISRNWKPLLGTELQIDVRVVAKVTSEDVYVKPDYSTITVPVKSYMPTSVPIYLIGSATPAQNNLSNAILMSEVERGEIYKWRGNMTNGGFKFLRSTKSWLPSYNRGANNQTVVERKNESDPDDLFTIPSPGPYYMVYDRPNGKLKCEKTQYAVVYYTGVGNGWTFQPMDWDYENPDVFILETNLPEGQFKFSVAADWGGPFFMPPKGGDVSINTGKTVEYRISPDEYWRVKEEEKGNYRIVLDTKNLKISITKI